MRLGEAATSGAHPLKGCYPHSAAQLCCWSPWTLGQRGTDAKALWKASPPAKSTKGEAFLHPALPLGRGRDSHTHTWWCSGALRWLLLKGGADAKPHCLAGDSSKKIQRRVSQFHLLLIAIILTSALPQLMCAK